MKTKKQQYYILYKVIRDEAQRIQDIQYLQEFANYNDIQQATRIHKTNIKKMINNNYNNNISTFKDFTIIKELY